MTPKPVRIDEITGVYSFIQSVDWDEKWLWGLVGFHVLCCCLSFVTYRVHNVQMVLFLIYLSLVYCSEWINEWAAKHYSLFAHQQYFDSRGIFISIMFSTPLILNTVGILSYWLYSTLNLFVIVKRAKMRKLTKKAEKTE